MVAPLFNGLVDPAARDKTPINVPLAAAQAFPDASEASQSLLVGLISRTARPAGTRFTTIRSRERDPAALWHNASLQSGRAAGIAA